MGLDGWQPSFKKHAERLGIKEVFLDELYGLKDLVFISLEFDQIIKTSKFLTSQLYNIHFSLLPKYKGMYTSCLPLLNGDMESGVTLHRMDDGIDTGEIIDQEIFPIPLSLNGYGLYLAYLKHSFFLFKKNIDSILENKVKSEPQNNLFSTYYSKKSIDFSVIEIDFRQTGFQVHNQIRAFSFRPFQLPIIDGFKISHSIITQKRSISKPGSFTQDTAVKRIYSTIDFDVIVYFDQLDLILQEAKENNLSSIAKRTEEGYNLTEKNELGWDPLIVAAYHNSFDVLKYLLDNGANPNTTNNKGTSVLMYAMTASVTNNDFKSMEYLIASGANLGHSDYTGISLMEYAEKYGNVSVIDFLSLHSK
ncbi:formyltransferase family protein [Rhodonellum sp.]|uniref:formyltransferase family protein n=1 Tax=Rhodonellum sp. TaxID=2231180 RepID=UPI0027171775|nr:formyltransferase family protein [Rhodonellum sp.]MDO9551448.1 formyltransferase family protein [Rhodonellum sp.]